MSAIASRETELRAPVAGGGGPRGLESLLIQATTCGILLFDTVVDHAEIERPFLKASLADSAPAVFGNRILPTEHRSIPFVLLICTVVCHRPVAGPFFFAFAQRAGEQITTLAQTQVQFFLVNDEITNLLVHAVFDHGVVSAPFAIAVFLRGAFGETCGDLCVSFSEGFSGRNMDGQQDRCERFSNHYRIQSFFNRAGKVQSSCFNYQTKFDSLVAGAVQNEHLLDGHMPAKSWLPPAPALRLDASWFPCDMTIHIIAAVEVMGS